MYSSKCGTSTGTNVDLTTTASNKSKIIPQVSSSSKMSASKLTSAEPIVVIVKPYSFNKLLASITTDTIPLSISAS